MLSCIRKSMADKDLGFTLIELLVVIIIIGILAAIAIPVFLNQRKKGVDASLKSDLKAAATAVETWRTDNPQTALTSYYLNPGSHGVTGSLNGFRPSPGSTVMLYPNTTAGMVGAYCIGAWNAGSSKATTNVLWMQYASGAGGLLTTPPAAFTGCT